MQTYVLQFIVLVLLLQPLPAAAAGPAEAEQKAAELATLRARIAEIEADIDSAETQLNTLHKELRATQLIIERGLRALRALDEQIADKTQWLGKLDAKKKAKLKELDIEKGYLAKQIVAAYMIGRQDRIKLLLNQADIARIDRALIYHDYFTRARAQRINAVAQTLAEIDGLKQTIRRETEGLSRLRTQRHVELKEIETQRQRRNQIIAKLEAQIRHHSDELRVLRADEERLDKLVQSLQAAASRGLPPFDSGQQFGALKGQLAWPTPGPVIRRFGSTRQHESLKWQGVVIDAKTGTDVQAVGHGRIAFADSFRPLGMLIVVDHGDGYMTLYGHNQTLYRSAGDVVKAGETIATVGDTGDGLYFEVRHQGTPVDPALWCKQQGTAHDLGRR